MTHAFELRQDQVALRERARAIARRSLRPLALASTPGRLDRPLVQMLGKSGLLKKLFPLAQGDERQVSATDLCLLREGIALECTEGETALALQGLGAYPILQSGSDALVREWIPRVASGEVVAAFALSEPAAGSDPGGLSLAATQTDDARFRLTGTKTWISNAPEADVYTVFARTSEGSGARGITAFVVPGDAPGLGGTRLALIQPHPIGTLVLDGVVVPRSSVLGEIGEGFKVAMRTLDLFRPSVGAFCVGMAQRALDLAVAWAGERQAFGRPIKDFQAVSHQLAEMATRTRAARLLVYAAASTFDAGVERNTKDAAMAKLYASETAQFVVDAAVQIVGARALEQGHPLAQLYLEVRAPRIYEGTSEIQREVIARQLFATRA